LSLETHSNYGIPDYFQFFKASDNNQLYSGINTSSEFNDLYNLKLDFNLDNDNLDNDYVSHETISSEFERREENNSQYNSIENIREQSSENTTTNTITEYRAEYKKEDKREEANSAIDKKAEDLASASKTDNRVKTDQPAEKNKENTHKLEDKQEIHKEQLIQQKTFNQKSVKELEIDEPEKTIIPEKLKIIEQKPAQKIKINNNLEMIEQSDLFSEDETGELNEVAALFSELNENAVVDDKVNIDKANLKNAVQNDKTETELNAINKSVLDENGQTAAKVVIIDARTHKTSSKVTDTQSAKNRNTEQNITLVKSENTATSKNNEIEIIQRVSIDNVAKETDAKAQNQVKNINNSSLERFSEILKNETVKQTSMILKDNGKGEIKLILKPESLGNVRIKVLLDNNNIEGRIIVENISIKEMFESNLSELEQAFKEEGFESASLEVSVSGQGAENKEEEQGFLQYGTADEFEKNISFISEYMTDDTYINIIV